MFVKSTMTEKVTYSAKGSRIDIKPGINLITNPLITIQELQNCYGKTRIYLVEEPKAEKVKKETPVEVKKETPVEVVKKTNTKKVTNTKKTTNTKGKAKKSKKE